MAEAREADVVVVGGGQAGLAAAITAAEAGARVLLLEKSPRSRRGGNSRHTRNLRPLHNVAQPPLEGAYDYREYADDLARVTAGFTDEPLAELTLRESADCVDWLQERGVAFQKPLTGTLHLARTNAFFLGGGKAMMNALYRHAEHLGIEILYAVEDVQLDCHHGDFKGLSFQLGGTVYEVQARSLVAAAGGFEANHEWLADGWGEAAENFLVRGTPDNQGEILAQMLAAGCESVGDVSQCHAVAIDGRAPRFDGGICTRVDAVPFGIVVNREGARFYDEGEDFWPKRYAIWGRLIAKQPGQVAYSIIDSQSHDLFMPTVYPALEADSIG
ncbi:MAG: FAD-dependent tricarballylate dehydrogenase TcuA, partial [Gammaproteobacteria bacterium]